MDAVVLPSVAELPGLLSAISALPWAAAASGPTRSAAKSSAPATEASSSRAAAAKTGGIRVLCPERIASATRLKHLGRAGIRGCILRKALAQTSGYQKRLIAVLSAGGHRLRLIRADFALDLRIQLVLPVGSIARELRHASGSRRLAQLQAEIHHRRLRIVRRLLDRFETEHLDLNRAGALTQLREGIVAILIGGGDELFLALRRRNRGPRDGHIPGLYESALRVERRAKRHQRQPVQRDRFGQGQEVFRLKAPSERRMRHPQTVGRRGRTRGYLKGMGGGHETNED